MSATDLLHSDGDSDCEVTVAENGAAEVAGEAGRTDAVYPTGKPMGERLLRELQRKAARRMLERRNLLLSEGGHRLPAAWCPFTQPNPISQPLAVV